MAEVDFKSEKISLGSAAKKQIRYGSMAKETSVKPIKVIKHDVQTGDTLQGLALRYGVTMEQIKRANKMWTTDSLFLRPTLDIPVFSESLMVSSLSQALPESAAITQVGTPDVYLIDSTNHNVADKFSASVVTVNDNFNQEESAADFLIRIDSHIAKSKDEVLKLQKKAACSDSELQNAEERFLQTFEHKCTMMASSSLSDLSADPALPPQPVVMTQGRKVRSSLKKLEREKDEIFEL